MKHVTTNTLEIIVRTQNILMQINRHKGVVFVFPYPPGTTSGPMVKNFLNMFSQNL